MKRWAAWLAGGLVLWLALVFVLALQFIAVHWAPAQDIFGTTDLELDDWMLAAAVASSVLLLDEARKFAAFIFRRKTRMKTRRDHAAND